ncbi:hypothetical protein MUK42_17731, partial [Musa troglodytarum]
MDLDPAALTGSDVSVPSSRPSLLRISLENNNMITSKTALEHLKSLPSLSGLSAELSRMMSASFAARLRCSQQLPHLTTKPQSSSKLNLTPQSETIPIQVSLQVFFEWSTAVLSLSLSLAWWSTEAPLRWVGGTPIPPDIYALLLLVAVQATGKPKMEQLDWTTLLNLRSHAHLKAPRISMDRDFSCRIQDL